MSTCNNRQLLRCEQLRRCVSGTLVLDVEKLELDSGRTYILSGVNGAGKTSLLRVLAGLDRAACDRFRFDGEDADLGSYPNRLRKQIAFVHHHPVMFSKSVADNVGYGLRGTGLAHAEIVRRTVIALDWAGIGDLAARPANALSAGERQRVALARAHALDPLLYLLDEPTTNLDQEGRQVVTRMIDAIGKEGRTLLIACHDRELLNLASVSRLNMVAGRLQVA